MLQNDFVDLNRTFREIPDHPDFKDEDTQSILSQLGRHSKELSWPELLNEYRIVILAEAGSGKTQEIYHAAVKMRAEGKAAFFVRLEYISDGFENSFDEVGTYQEFKTWINTDDEAWLFLDSVDESRLKNPQDFENAIRKISSELSTALQRVHIILTGRPQAWRWKSDLAWCEKKLGFIKPVVQEKVSNVSQAPNDEDWIDLEEDTTFKSGSGEMAKRGEASYKFYTLSDLSFGQAETLAKTRNTPDISFFLRELNKREGMWRVARPKDLSEVLDYWEKNKKIGSDAQLMEFSIAKRLEEIDQNRDEANPLSKRDAHEGAKTLASAIALIRKQTIQTLDGSHSGEGLPINSILADWGINSCNALLGRPVFLPANYGSMRFYHRSVWEYLAAVWLSERLKNNASRQRIENLFFREQYGMKVVVPSMRSVLPWLILFDEKIRKKALEIEPEIAFEGGDPSQLPLSIRQSLLRAVCEKVATRVENRSVSDRQAVQRFTRTDMAQDIKALLAQYAENEDVVQLLLRMIWQGSVKECLPEAKRHALDTQTEQYARITAIRTVKEIGTDDDFAEILESFSAEKAPHNRRVLAELIDELGDKTDYIEWVLSAISKASDRKKYDSDGLTYSLTEFAKRLSPDNAAKLAQGLFSLLEQEPLIERRYCHVSQKYQWLMSVCARAVEKLVIARHKEVFSHYVLSTLLKIPAFQSYEHDHLTGEVDKKIDELVGEWPELNYHLFWKAVEECRKDRTFETISYHQVYIIGKHSWAFSPDDFEKIVADIKGRPLLEDRRVALSLAFHLYQLNDRPKKWLNILLSVVDGEGGLQNDLNVRLNPPPPSDKEKKFKRQEAEWERQRKKRKEKSIKDAEKWKQFLADNIDKIRETQKHGINNGHLYLIEKMRELKPSHSRWASNNWEDLLKEFSPEIVQAFRDGAMQYWKTYTPDLYSEKADKNSVTWKTILGLTGLAILDKYKPDWVENLTDDEALLACRYAVSEMNGFPDWFLKLYKKFPSVISAFILKEIKWELNTMPAQGERHYLLSPIKWHASWLWDDLVRGILNALPENLKNTNALETVLRIIQGSHEISDRELAAIAAKKCKAEIEIDILSYWFSVWIGSSPKEAIPMFSSRLEGIKDATEATKFAMQTIVSLVGERREVSGARENYKTAPHLKELYILMHRYIRTEEDFERANTGCYSPELRDHAQEARNKLFSMLSKLEGKESYLAMIELSQVHPVLSYRNWMLRSAKEKAEKDADRSALSVGQFIDFAKTLDFTPSTNRELYDLALSRLSDLKAHLEDGDDSPASTWILQGDETEVRNLIGNWCRDKASGRYSIVQEEELADGKRTDFRFHRPEIDAPIPVELKIADKWSGNELLERLENQLAGDYLRDKRSVCGIFLLVYRGVDRSSWQIPNKIVFEELISNLQSHWESLSSKYPQIEVVTVLGIDLTKRGGKK